MKRKDVIKSGRQVKGDVKGINRNIMVFAFFLLLSFIFWYLNSLGNTLEADMKYPVNYINLPKNRSFEEPLPGKLNLNIAGQGYSILQLKITAKNTPLVVDLSRISFRRIPAEKSSKYFIVTSGLVQEFNLQLRSDCKIISVKPDTLYFSLK